MKPSDSDTNQKSKLEKAVNHTLGCVSGVRPCIVVAGMLFPSGAIRNKARPRSPPRLVFLQVNEHANLAALLVRDKLDAAHASIVLQLPRSAR